MHYEDEIYHSGYLDGYYAGMELYHSDEMTDAEKEKAKARRKRRGRNIALGVGAAAAVGAGIGGYKIGRAIHRKRRNLKRIGGLGLKRVKVDRKDPADYMVPKGWDHRKNKPTYGVFDRDDKYYKFRYYDRWKRHVWDPDKKDMVYAPEYDEKYQKEKEDFAQALKWANRAMHWH